MADGFHADGAAVNLDRPEGGARAAGGRLTAALAAYNRAMRWGRDFPDSFLLAKQAGGITWRGVFGILFRRGWAIWLRSWQ